MRSEKTNKLVHSETTHVVFVERSGQLFRLLQANVMLEQLKYFSQVLSLHFWISLGMLNGIEIEIVENVLDLSNLIVFKSPKLFVVDSEILVCGGLLFSCKGAPCYIRLLE